jgi:allantoicase
MFFGERNNLIAPGRPRDMSSGWETRRRRGPGHDWNLVQLGRPGTIRRVEVDTTHFKGNAPGRVALEVCDEPGATAEALAGGAVDWRVLLPQSPSQPHTRHVFERELRCAGRATHLRLSLFPDGGVARLRAYGEPEVPDARAAAVQRLNTLPRPEALSAMRACCGSLRWAERMADARPFENATTTLRIAERTFWGLGEVDLLEAFAAHPRLGEQKPDGKWAAQEQAGAAAASEETLAALAQANRDYLDRYGFVFLLCATGRSAGEMLQAVHERLGRTRPQELRTAAEEQAKILRLRLESWLDE